MQAGAFSPPEHCRPLQCSGLFSSQAVHSGEVGPGRVLQLAEVLEDPGPSTLPRGSGLRFIQREKEKVRERVLCHVTFHQEDLLSRSLQQTSIAGRPTLHAHLWLQGARDTEYLALSASAVRVGSTSLEKEEGLVGVGT